MAVKVTFTSKLGSELRLEGLADLASLVSQGPGMTLR